MFGLEVAVPIALVLIIAFFIWRRKWQRDFDRMVEKARVNQGKQTGETIEFFDIHPKQTIRFIEDDQTFDPN